MELPYALAGGLTTLAFLAHLVVGSRETRSLEPSPDAEAARKRHWVQALCAFQMVSVDLALVAGVLLTLAFSEIVPGEEGVALVVAALLALWGAAWLVQLALLRRPARDYLLLGQWIFRTDWVSCGWPPLAHLVHA